jgi:FkbM family methyltransferase
VQNSAGDSGVAKNLLQIWRRICWAAIYWGPRRDVTVNTLNGLLTFDSKDWLIGKYLYVRREHESDELAKVAELLQAEGYLADSRPPTAVMNVGANLGMTVIGLLKQGYFQRAIAFEPTPDSYRLLVRNIQQNGLADRILHFPFALSSSEGSIELEICADNSGDNRIRISKQPGFFAEEKRTTVSAAVKTLDGLMAESAALRNESVGLVWMDIQGHEGHFFAGAREFFKRGIPVVSEIWPYALDRSGMSLLEFRALLGEMFSHFYVLGSTPACKLPISEVDTMFTKFAGPRDMCVALFLPGSKP